MYITDNINVKSDEKFDWDSYFSKNNKDQRISNSSGINIINKIRGYLSESPHKMILVLDRLMRKVMKGHKFDAPKVLELGAATGLLTRWIIDQNGGRGTLIDNNTSSYEAFKRTIKGFEDEYTIEYQLEDIFNYETDDLYDIVCSFGLVEHFPEKNQILNQHKKFLKKDGVVIILVPIYSLLSRVYWDLHPELNLGYRELMTMDQFEKALEENSLKVVSIEKSNEYVYDFAAALCIPR